MSVLVVGARPVHAAPTTFTVNSTADTDDGACTPQGIFGRDCTLREAINAANSNDNDPAVDLISFSIPGEGVKTITVTQDSFLPVIDEAVTIDGYTQPGATPNTLTQPGRTDANLLIELDGTNVGPGTSGLVIVGSNITVRGLVINRFSADGIRIAAGLGTNNKVEGNFIGTDPSGTQALGNGVFFAGSGNEGAVFVSSGDNTTIGGATKEARNLISGNNTTGIRLQSSDNTVAGNLIGTQKDGKTALPNLRSGVNLDSGTIATTVGGNTANASNVIAFNSEDGVLVGSSKDFSVTNDIRILRNSIFSNGQEGIDLNGTASSDSDGDGPTANDGGTADDADTGPNGLQNKPNLTSALTSNGTTTIQGVLDTKPNTTYTVRFFSQGSGNEGKNFIGQKQIPTDEDGRVTFSFSPARGVAAGQKITATATGSEGTSEFSAPREVTAS